MILITVAMPIEAAPLVSALGLKSLNDKFYRLYESAEFMLVITGIGREAASSALSYVFGKFDNIKGAVNFGFAGTLDSAIPVGTLCAVNSFHLETDEKRALFPDMIFKHNLVEHSLETVDKIISEAPSKASVLVDEEGYGFASSALIFLKCDRMLSIKLVSDDATKKSSLTLDFLKNLINNALPEVVETVKRFSSYCNEEERAFPPEFYEIAKKINVFYDLTVAQQNILKNALHNTFVTYNLLPDLEKLPFFQGHGKKNIAPAFEELLENMAHNVNCIPYELPQSAQNEETHFFSHIYVENSISNTEYVAEILNKNPSSKVVKIPHYKSVFNRPHQNEAVQRRNKNLILANATGNLLYKGSGYCNAFGFERFYYCSTVIGCVYNCEYCYLQGMYPTSNITAFVNISDFFSAIDSVDDGSPMLICCSYDSDIVALDGILGTVSKWLDFARTKPHITFEIRTKSNNTKPFLSGVPDNVIVAYTLSPSGTDSAFESSAPSVELRIKAAEKLASLGVRVRLCLEPSLVPIVAKESYFALADRIIDSAASHRYEDIVVGSFRMNKAYYKTIAEKLRFSKLFHSPFAEFNSDSVTFAHQDEVINALADKIEQKTSLKTVRFI